MSFLKNSWYCTGWSPDVGEKPVHRKVIGEDIVLFRDASGKVNAISDKCPHRFAPLHKGQVVGDTVVCPYHGLRFDGTGTCVLNPHGNGQVPPRQHTDSYPVEERGGTIWIWMGDPAKADPDQIVDTSFLADTGTYVSISGHHEVKAHYFLAVDNLLDLTHAQFLHPETVYGVPATDRWTVHLSDKAKAKEEAGQEVWFDEDETSLTAHYKLRDKPTPPMWEAISGYKTVDMYVASTWLAPANMVFYVEVDSKVPGEEAFTMKALHFMTPIDDMNFYYFYAVGWDLNIDDKAIPDRVHEIAKQTIIDEDGPMLEDCQAYMGDTSDLFSLRPLLLQTDGVAIKARRRMEKLVEAQNSGSDAREAA